MRRRPDSKDRSSLEQEARAALEPHLTKHRGDHPSLEILARHAERKLSATETAVVTDHLVACEDCRGLRLLLTAESRGSSTFKSRLGSPILAWTLAAAASILIGVFAFRPFGTDKTLPATVPSEIPLLAELQAVDRADPLRDGGQPRSLRLDRATLLLLVAHPSLQGHRGLSLRVDSPQQSLPVEPRSELPGQFLAVLRPGEVADGDRTLRLVDDQTEETLAVFRVLVTSN